MYSEGASSMVRAMSFCAEDDEEEDGGARETSQRTSGQRCWK